ncbi:MAG TPA: GNAT family N-acetyltransferase [Casimicrobiaceae bacterium]|nr:GNAT family N-acetyltransferase [Casimicrobiaceae bacterium]
MGRDDGATASTLSAWSSPVVDVRMLGPSDLRLLAGAPVDLAGGVADPTLALAILADPRRYVVAGMAGGRIVGIGSAARAERGRTLVIHGVVVAHPHRRRGLGARLLATLLEHARASGCRDACIDVEREDAALRALCARAGGNERPDPIVRVAFALR